jgi:hypothetical protein
VRAENGSDRQGGNEPNSLLGDPNRRPGRCSESKRETAKKSGTGDAFCSARLTDAEIEMRNEKRLTKNENGLVGNEDKEGTKIRKPNTFRNDENQQELQSRRKYRSDLAPWMREQKGTEQHPSKMQNIIFH